MSALKEINAVMTKKYLCDLAAAYFYDLASNDREHSEEHLNAWLWHTCPAHLRDKVRAEIQRLLAEAIKQ